MVFIVPTLNRVCSVIEKVILLELLFLNYLQVSVKMRHSWVWNFWDELRMNVDSFGCHDCCANHVGHKEKSGESKRCNKDLSPVH